MNRRNRNNNKTFTLLTALILLNLFACLNSPENISDPPEDVKINPAGYDLSAPDETIILPPVLLEVSGISLLDTNSVACIQDESGIVYIVDLERNEITHYSWFYLDGDYEDLALVDNLIYVLRSDGILFRVDNYKISAYAQKTFSLGLSGDEYEGLCLDEKNNRLLILPKSNFVRGSQYPDRHPVYGFDLKNEEFFTEPVFDFDLGLIKKYAADSLGYSRGKETGKSKTDLPEILFRPSAFAINPLTGKIFVLSAAEHLLFIFNMNGDIEYIEKLDPEIFNAPEGISFFNNGDLLISNEGKTSPPNILRFNNKLNF